MQRIVKDGVFDTVITFAKLKIPTINKDSEFPGKGNIIYNKLDEVDGTDGIVYYGDGEKWIELLSGSNISLANVGTSGAGSLVPGDFELGPDFTLKGLLAGSGIILSSDATDVTISNSSPASSSTLTNVGTVPSTGSLVPGDSEVGPNFTLKGLLAGSGIILSADSTDVTISNSTTLTNVGTAPGTGSLVPGDSEAGPNFTLKGLLAGTGITLATDGTDVTISNSSPSSEVTLTSLDPGAIGNLVPGSPQTNPLSIKAISAGTGISLTSLANDVQINNLVSLSGTGSGTSLVNQGVNPALVTKDLIPGTNVNFTGSSATQITVNASFTQIIVQLGGGNPQNTFTVPAGAVGAILTAAAGGGGGAGGNLASVGGQGGGSGASLIMPLIVGDTVSCSLLGVGGGSGTGGGIPTAGGNGTETHVSLNNSPPATLHGGQGGSNVLIDCGMYGFGTPVPLGFTAFQPQQNTAYPGSAAGQAYFQGFNGHPNAPSGSSNAAGGTAGLNGANGNCIWMRAGGGFGGVGSSGGGGGGGAGSGISQGGTGGFGWISGGGDAGDGVSGSNGSGGGGGGGGFASQNPGDGGSGGDGICIVTYSF